MPDAAGRAVYRSHSNTGRGQHYHAEPDSDGEAKRHTAGNGDEYGVADADADCRRIITDAYPKRARDGQLQPILSTAREGRAGHTSCPDGLDWRG